MYGPGSTTFSLHSSSGVVSLAEALNYEKIPQYTLTVKVSDGQGKTVTTSLTITVQDINDEPEFIGTPYSTSVDENLATDSIVFQAVATDADGDPLSYSISGTNSSHFEISNSTGLIRTADILNFEELSSYSLLVIVSDGMVSVNQPITISVNDVNDGPLFLDAPYSLSVDENAVGAAVCTVNVTDSDNETLRYSLSGSGSAHFTIHQSTGLISLTQALNFELASVYVLTVTVSDKRGGLNSTTLSVQVTDLNDSPQFINTPYSVSIDENIDVGSNVVLASAFDEDAGTALTYSLSGSNSSHFAVSNTGIVSTAQGIDFESVSSYSLSVEVSDNSVSVSTAFTVTVNNINDAPEFHGAPYSVTIDENTAASTSIAQVTASDQDGDSITFSFVGITSSDFSIHGSSGIISTAVKINFEQTAGYVLTVQADDGNGGKTIISVTVNVTDLNDEFPAFGRASYSGHVTENVVQSSSVMTITATDTDAADSSLAYSLSGANSSHFSVTSGGLIQTADDIDYESVPGYSLTLTATDGRGNTGTTTIIISVTNVIDNDPVFSGLSYNASVAEGSSPGTSVTRITATDVDVDDVIIYNMSGE